MKIDLNENYMNPLLKKIIEYALVVAISVATTAILTLTIWRPYLTGPSGSPGANGRDGNNGETLILLPNDPASATTGQSPDEIWPDTNTNTATTNTDCIHDWDCGFPENINVPVSPADGRI